MRGYHTIFDREKKRVGFAPPALEPCDAVYQGMVNETALPVDINQQLEDALYVALTVTITICLMCTLCALVKGIYQKFLAKPNVVNYDAASVGADGGDYVVMED